MSLIHWEEFVSQAIRLGVCPHMTAAHRLFSAVLLLLLVAACAPSGGTPTAAPPPPTAAAKPAAVTPPPAAAAASPSPAAGASPSPAAAAAASPAASPAPAAQPAPAAKPSAPVSGEVTVFAASSLTDVFNDMATAFQQANPNAKVTFNYGASSQLATQLGQGAKADAFASADQTQMDNAKKADAIAGPDTIFARNRLIIITPKDNPKNIAVVKDLGNDGVKFVTAQTSVPIGQYTQQMLDKASADPSIGSDFKSRVEANTVSKEDNVRQVVSKVQLGEADAAVVYSTDATPQVRDQLQIIQVPDAFQVLAAYPIAVAKGDNTAGGQAWVSYVLGPDGQATLAKWGFLPPTAAGASPQASPSPSGGGGAPANASAAAPAAAAPAPGVASSTYSPDVAVKGLVATPRSFTSEDLMKLPAETFQVTYQAGQGTDGGAFTGTRLLNVFDAAGGAKLPTDGNNAKLRVTVMVTGADGYQVIFGWGDLDPDFGAMPILLAYERDGQPMGDKQGMARLVVPGDKRGGRYVSTVKSIELADPGPAKQ
jgi:molybdate transport system substrate-binding protein